MTDQSGDNRLADARYEYHALLYDLALLTHDKRLEGDVYRRLVGTSERHVVTSLVVHALHVLVDNLTDTQREPVVDMLRARAARLVARFGERLDTDDGPALDDDELNDALRRFLDDEEGAP